MNMKVPSSPAEPLSSVKPLSTVHILPNTNKEKVLKQDCSDHLQHQMSTWEGDLNKTQAYIC